VIGIKWKYRLIFDVIKGEHDATKRGREVGKRELRKEAENASQQRGFNPLDANSQRPGTLLDRRPLPAIPGDELRSFHSRRPADAIAAPHLPKYSDRSKLPLDTTGPGTLYGSWANAADGPSNPTGQQARPQTAYGNRSGHRSTREINTKLGAQPLEPSSFHPSDTVSIPVGYGRPGATGYGQEGMSSRDVPQYGARSGGDATFDALQAGLAANQRRFGIEVEKQQGQRANAERKQAYENAMRIQQQRAREQRALGRSDHDNKIERNRES